LFQGRFKAILVDKDAYLLELCHYIVLNPIRVKGSEKMDAWKWSSYRATAGLASVPPFLSIDWLLGQFGTNRRAAQKRYREFVREGIKIDRGMNSKAGFTWAAMFYRKPLRQGQGTQGDSPNAAKSAQTNVRKTLCERRERGNSAGVSRARPSAARDCDLPRSTLCDSELETKKIEWRI
jgi:hypothetical protein